MFKILLILVITFILVIITFLILMSFLNNDIITYSKTIDKFNVQEPSYTGEAFINNVYGSTNEIYIQFISSGTLTIPYNLTCDILIVGGGGGGGSRHGGGGGAGSVIYLKNETLKSGTYNVSVGIGGKGQSSRGSGTNGIDSIISLNNNNIYLAKGGGYGSYNVEGGLGGSGGGSSTISHNIGKSINNNIPSGLYGNNGGKGTNYDGYYNEFSYAGGGGGGASSPGTNAESYSYYSKQGDGGNGRQIDITGLNTYYGGGGGGGSYLYSYGNGAGGLGGGGAGSKGAKPATSGTANTGGGGGGAGYQGNKDGTSGNGGSGVVIIRYIGNDTSLNIDSITNLFKNKLPWGMYFAENVNGIYLKDVSGNNRDATLSGNIYRDYKNGNGASSKIRYIYGGTSSSITWPSGSIPINYTILSLTRYTGRNKGRILTGNNADNRNPNDNWLQGHWGGKRGLCYYRGWKTDWNNNIGNNEDWLCCIGKNGGNTPYNILLDGVPSGLYMGGSGDLSLSINRTLWGENSDWALSCVIIWDRHLEDGEMRLLNAFINLYKNTGKSLYDIIYTIDNSFTTSDGENENENIILSTNEQYNLDNQAFYYTPMWDSVNNASMINIIQLKQNDNFYTGKFNNNRFDNAGSFSGNGIGEKITILFNRAFVLKKIIIIADSNYRINAPAAWTINIGSDGTTLSGTAKSQDYDAFQGKSQNYCVSFYIDNNSISDTYDIIFKKTLGGTQLKFTRIIFFEGTSPNTIATNWEGIMTT